MPFYLTTDYIIVPIDNQLILIGTEYDLDTVLIVWGQETYQETLDLIVSLGFDVAIEIYHKYHLFRPIIYADFYFPI